MRRLLLLLACAACTGDDPPLPDCSEATIDVRPFEGAPVERTWIECGGELADNCDPPFATYVEDRCGGTQVYAGAYWIGYKALLFLDDGGTRAAARLSYSTDVPSDWVDKEAQGGWVSIEVWDPPDAIKGAFEVEFADSAIRGTFDSTESPPI